MHKCLKQFKAILNTAVILSEQIQPATVGMHPHCASENKFHSV